ncbi:MAG: UDP-N-acetylmuramoyl-L-alanyl-D-glutamate--2,6-diaminopimelate ligase [Sedimentisphaerales bacterium]|nr:UDP-N-acetylmuramoyl-L-alanyl-D-glutamate--2,6-diaminopimelate ligase [Sedimentisphaerales bacterium]
MTWTQLLALVQSKGERIGLTADSRQVSQGDIFVAVSGTHVDGHDFIPQAMTKGPAYIVSQNPFSSEKVQVVIVPDSAEALGQLAQARYGYPAAKLCNLAVTGTNGKTTVAYLVRSIIRSAGGQCGLIGTIEYDACNGESIPAPLTTPDALEVARLGRAMVDSGAEFMVVEASSHALSQKRLSGVDFTAAAFTNLTGDHLDYHKTEEEYLAAKARLFSQLPVHGTAIFNRQSPASEKIAAVTRARKFWYAIDEPADIEARIHTMDSAKTVYSLRFGDVMEQVVTPMIGRHNVSNQLAAAGLCLAAGFHLTKIAIGLSRFPYVPGRLEPVEGGQDFRVLVDYAHTDDALVNVLTTLRPLCEGRLIVLFGCGGDRDKTKRPRMANVAERLADMVVVTSDNPRTEEPGRIIEDILMGFSDRDSRRIIIEPDRRGAIEMAIRTARKNDIVLLAGKGHEDYQILGTQKIHFDDRQIAREILCGNNR